MSRALRTLPTKLFRRQIQLDGAQGIRQSLQLLLSDCSLQTCIYCPLDGWGSKGLLGLS